MKKLIFVLVLSITLLSCTQQGEVIYEPRDLFQYKGKTYQAFKIGTGDGNSIWVVLPKDSSVEVIPLQFPKGKQQASATIIP